MKKFLRTVAALGLALFLISPPALVAAATAPPDVSVESVTVDSLPPASSSSVIITEVSTGTKTTEAQEFVELYNLTDEPIDLTGWQFWYLSAQAADQNKPTASGIVKLGEGTATPVIMAHGYFVLSSRPDYLPSLAQQFYSGVSMAGTGGNVRLLSPDDDNPCLWRVQDQLGWGNALYPEGLAAAAPGTGAGKSLARLLGPDGGYVDSNNNASDFVLNSTPSPGVVNTQRATNSDVPITTDLPTVPIAGCTPPVLGPEPTPGGTSPLEPPTAPPPATVIDPAQPAGGSGPAPDPRPLFPPADVGLTTPQITEVLPNPAPPQTDAADEFIELYNSNDMPFDLRGFQLQIGLTTKHRYTFPAGITLAPHSFTSFFSADTSLALSNSGGQVSLLDPFGNTLNSSDPYGAAKDGQSWALGEGLWRWSTTPTPNAANVVTLPAASTKKKTATAAMAKSSTSTKAATQKPKASANATDVPSSFAADTPTRQIHPGILAAIASFAVLYGAYEYRKDLTNKLYQFRANRAARRAARAEAEGG